MKKVIIFGIGELARILYLYMKDQYNIIGFCVDEIYYQEKQTFMNKPILKTEDLKIDKEKNLYLIMAIGYKSMRNRKIKFLELKRKGFKFLNFIHESVISEGSIEGENNVIFPGVVIEHGVKIGANNIIWSGTTICHDARIGDHNFIAAGCTIGGFSNIYENNFIGFNSTIIQKINIGKEILIGAGTFVNKEPENYSKNYGVPIRKISTHKEKGIIIQE